MAGAPGKCCRTLLFPRLASRPTVGWIAMRNGPPAKNLSTLVEPSQENLRRIEIPSLSKKNEKQTGIATSIFIPPENIHGTGFSATFIRKTYDQKHSTS